MAQERRNDDRRRRREPEEERRERTRRPHRRSVRNSVSFAALYVVAVIGVSVLLACVGWIAANDVLALNKEPREVSVTVEKEDSFHDVVNMLKDEGLIEYKFLFKLFAGVTNGEDKVTMGTYTLNTDMDYRALLAGMSLHSATKAEVQVTIPEGYTVRQIFELLEEKGVATVADLNKEAAEHDYAFSFLQDIPLGEPERLEGFLYPDTYTFYTPHSALLAINKMLVNFDAKYTDEMRQQVKDSGYTIREILTIASLVEKETDGTDRGRIASVIYNRMNNPGMETAGFLQIDATLAYINGGRVPTNADREIDSPFNTYRNKGLPPAPIANPGIASIKAALNPEKTRYYYYVLGDNNLHHFSHTFNEHQNFINKQDRYK